MNEPSINNEDEFTMSKVAVHYKSDGGKVLHRDVHNAYGVLMAKATYEGLLKRD